MIDSGWVGFRLKSDDIEQGDTALSRQGALCRVPDVGGTLDPWRLQYFRPFPWLFVFPSEEGPNHAGLCPATPELPTTDRKNCALFVKQKELRLIITAGHHYTQKSQVPKDRIHNPNMKPVKAQEAVWA